MYKCLTFERHILSSPVLSGERWPHGPKGDNGKETKVNYSPGPQTGLIKREKKLSDPEFWRQAWSLENDHSLLNIWFKTGVPKDLRPMSSFRESGKGWGEV